MWLTALTSANKMISEVSGALIGERSMLDALIPAQHKLRVALNLGLSPTDAFGEAIKAAETSAMQTVHVSESHSVDSTNCKVLFSSNMFYMYTRIKYHESNITIFIYRYLVKL